MEKVKCPKCNNYMTYRSNLKHIDNKNSAYLCGYCGLRVSFNNYDELDKKLEVIKMKLKHGIAVREKKTNKLIEFIECRTGNSALKVLSGVRINLSPDYKAEEEGVSAEEINNIEG